MPSGSTKHKLAFKGATIMRALAQYGAADIDRFMQDIDKYSIGLDGWFDRVNTKSDTSYPPYNLVKVNENTYSLELALAGFASYEVKAYTEAGQLFVEAAKAEADEREYVHRGLAARSFKRSWTLSDDVEVDHVDFIDGILQVTLNRIVPEKHQKKIWYGSEETK
jgi:molecular chaperone IbpA|tara:strand:+ start:260 stop:754 length:495 start_codon:yes stop_codon:yes gene_type:complete